MKSRIRLKVSMLPLVCFIFGMLFALAGVYFIGTYVIGQTLQVYKAGNIRTEVCDTDDLSTYQVKGKTNGQ